jgi:hypothetical protein
MAAACARHGACLSLSGTMAEPRTLRCYEYVNRPYASVSELLHRDPLKLLQRATSSAAARATSLFANLRVHVAGIDIGVDVRVLVRRVRDLQTGPGIVPVTRVELSWEATRVAALFPTMLAELSAQPLSATETQLDIEGTYWLPLGLLGNAIDSTIGHRIAEATVHRLLGDLVEQIRDELKA